MDHFSEVADRLVDAQLISMAMVRATQRSLYTTADLLP